MENNIWNNASTPPKKDNAYLCRYIVSLGKNLENKEVGYMVIRYKKSYGGFLTPFHFSAYVTHWREINQLTKEDEQYEKNKTK